MERTLGPGALRQIARRPHDARLGPVSVRAEIVQFCSVGLVALALLAIGLALVLRRDTTRLAVDNAQAMAQLIGSAVAEPALGPGIVSSDPAAIARLDEALRPVMSRYDVVRVKIWTPEGRILYSDDHRLVGARFPLGAEDLAALRTGKPDAGVSDLTQPENVHERSEGKLLQVYSRIRGPDGGYLLFEAYFTFHTVAASSSRLWTEISPEVFGALLLLALIQFPVGYLLVRKLRRAHRVREDLVIRAVLASDSERMQIATDLHDGVVQQLTAVSLVLGMATADSAPVTLDAELRSKMIEAADWTRQSIRELRELLVNLTWTSAFSPGAEASLDRMVAPLRDAGIAVEMLVEHGSEGPAVDALILRAAQEALRNVVAHAHAAHVSIRLQRVGGSVEMRIHDDGRGFDTSCFARPPVGGHLGLRLLHDLIATAGGSLTVASAPALGTEVLLRLPPTSRRRRPAPASRGPARWYAELQPVAT